MNYPPSLRSNSTIQSQSTILDIASESPMFPDAVQDNYVKTVCSNGSAQKSFRSNGGHPQSKSSVSVRNSHSIPSHNSSIKHHHQYNPGSYSSNSRHNRRSSRQSHFSPPKTSSRNRNGRNNDMTSQYSDHMNHVHDNNPHKLVRSAKSEIPTPQNRIHSLSPSSSRANSEPYLNRYSRNDCEIKRKKEQSYHNMDQGSTRAGGYANVPTRDSEHSYHNVDQGSPCTDRYTNGPTRDRFSDRKYHNNHGSRENSFKHIPPMVERRTSNQHQMNECHSDPNTVKSKGANIPQSLSYECNGRNHPPPHYNEDHFADRGNYRHKGELKTYPPRSFDDSSTIPSQEQMEHYIPKVEDASVPSSIKCHESDNNFSRPIESKENDCSNVNRSHSQQYDQSHSRQYDPKHSQHHNQSHHKQHNQSHSQQHNENHSEQYDPKYSQRYDPKYSQRYDQKHSKQHYQNHSQQYDSKYSQRYDQKHFQQHYQNNSQQHNRSHSQQHDATSSPQLSESAVYDKRRNTHDNNPYHQKEKNTDRKSMANMQNSPSHSYVPKGSNSFYNPESDAQRQIQVEEVHTMKDPINIPRNLSHSTSLSTHEMQIPDFQVVGSSQVTDSTDICTSFDSQSQSLSNSDRYRHSSGSKQTIVNINAYREPSPVMIVSRPEDGHNDNLTRILFSAANKEKTPTSSNTTTTANNSTYNFTNKEKPKNNSRLEIMQEIGIAMEMRQKAKVSEETGDYMFWLNHIEKLNKELELMKFQHEDSDKNSIQEKEDSHNVCIQSNDEPTNTSFQSNDSRNTSFPSNDCHNISIQSNDSRNISFQSNDCQNNSLQSDDPRNASFHSKDSRNNSYQSNDSRNNTYQSNDSRNNSFQSNDPKNASFQSNDLRNSSFQSNDPRNASFQSNDHNNISLHSHDSRNNSFQSNDSRNTSYQSGDSLPPRPRDKPVSILKTKVMTVQEEIRQEKNNKPISILKNTTTNNNDDNNLTKTIKIRAPADLDAGHVFTVNVKGEAIKAIVPLGGVTKGDIFPIQVPIRSPARNSIANSSSSSPELTQSKNKIKVRAPTDLKEGFIFTVKVKGGIVTAPVPKGGVKKGEIFLIPRA